MDDTIVALSTPPGTGALGVVRLSGPRAIEIADRLFVGRRRLAAAPARHMQLGTVRDPRTGDSIDQVLATPMRAPATYTGEEMVEFSGHGGPLICRLMVEAAVECGARPAAPGEFTRRAFQNGRIDLAQAEAVAELIQARGERALRNALAQLAGGLSSRIREVRGNLLDLLAPLEASIDFSDDVPAGPAAPELALGIERARQAIERLLAGQARGRLMTEGATVALVGRPNVGKSSLLNALAGQDRALVHELPGTTRDTIDITLALGGVPIRLVDTAGIRATLDPVEAAGVERAMQVAGGAVVTVLVLDGSRPPEEDDRTAAASLAGSAFIVARNKADLDEDPACRAFARELGGAQLQVCALDGRGVDALAGLIMAHLDGESGGEESVTMTRARHFEALDRSRAALVRCVAAVAGGAYADMVAAEMREALDALGEVTGETVGPDILDRIFSTFCIGK